MVWRCVESTKLSGSNVGENENNFPVNKYWVCGSVCGELCLVAVCECRVIENMTGELLQEYEARWAKLNLVYILVLLTTELALF